MNDLDELIRFDAVAQAELVRRREISPDELLDGYERRLRALNPLLRAVVTSDTRAARERIRQGDVTGPLAFVPFLIKDVVPYPGLRWSMGSRLFADNVAPVGSPFTERLDAAGLLTVGKTATSELGLAGSTETLLEGVTHNPWSLAHSASGSSGGAAAAVAAGIVPLAHANDGGGSIRIPASVCGVFGLKPSRGRIVPTSNVRSDFADLVSELCVSRTVRDSALFLSVVETDDVPGLERVGNVTGPGKRRLRIGTWTQTLLGTEPDPDVRIAYDDALALCRELGHEIVEANAPRVDGKALSDGFFAVAGAAMSGMIRVMGGLLKRPIGAGDLEPFTLSLAKAHDERPAALEAARAAFAVAARIYSAAVEAHDVVLTPTLAVAPFPLGHLSPLLDPGELIARTERAVGYTPIHNIAGLPAMSVPLHVSARGLPIGVQFAARFGDEATLLSLAYELERARPFQGRLAPYSFENLSKA
jgi:amidase